MRLNHFKSVLILIIFLSPIFSLAVQAQTENKLVTITDPLNPLAEQISGTYVYQGLHTSGGAESDQKVRPYYKNGSYYLYADYFSDVEFTFPDYFAWYITEDSSLPTAPNNYIYVGWHEPFDSELDYPEECNGWSHYTHGGVVTVVIVNAASGVAPTVSTLEASLVTTTSGTMGGNVTADGGAVTDRGFVYSSTDITPTIGEPGVTQITKGTGTGNYTELTSGLTAGVTYYYQAYGHNEHGTTYGGVKSFTTPTTSSPNKYVSGITNDNATNGVYIWIGNYYGKPAWKHETLNYWVYYSRMGVSNPTSYKWYIDNQLRDEHGAGDHYFYHDDAATCPSTGWSSGSGNGIGTGTPLVVDYPQIDFTDGSAYSPGNPTGGSTNNPIGRFFLDADIAGASLTAATITVSGTRTNVSNLKLWSSSDATFGSDTQCGSSQSDGASVTFSGFSSAISATGTYYFITADLASSASGTIALTIGSKTNLTYSGGASSTVFTDAPLSNGTITIVELPGISINDVSANENLGTVNFTITLSKTHSSDITVNYATANNTATLADNDYTNTSGTATVTAGQLTTTVSVAITGDSKYETNESFYVNLSNASYGYISDGQGVGTITNDDSQPSVTLGLSGSPLAENGGTATLTATLSNLSYQNVTVNLGYTGTATGGGTDYSAAASITVNAGSLSNTTSITGVDDALGEGNETVIVDISSVTNGTESGTQQVTATITDDDYSITVNDVSVNENAGNATFTITISQAYSSDITIDCATADNTATTADNDYTSASSTATITATQTTTTVAVPITNDTHYEQNETFYLNLSNASFGTITDAQGVGTITNEDTQPSVTLGLSNSPLAENGGVATVTATLSNRSYQNVTVNLGYTGTATGGGTDYSAAASITVNAGSLSNTASITGVDDALSEGNETVVVDISSVTNGTENGTQQVTATITDDDSEINVVGNGNTIADGDVTPSTTDDTNFGSTTLSNTISKTFTIQNTGAITLTLGANAVSISGGQSGDFTVTDQPAATIAVGSSDTFTIQFSPTAGGTRSTTINIANDDADENPYNFTIQGVGIPTITSAAYNYSTNVLTVTGTGFVANAGAANDVDISKLTITGEGGGAYTITSATDIEISSATEFSLTLGGVDLTNIETLVNKDGTSSAGNTTYNLAAAEDWLTGMNPVENIADLTGNGITVSNYANPEITSATYDASTGVLVGTGTNLVNKSGINNDINASFISITGDGGNSYALLNTSNVEITSATSFTLTLNSTDKLNVNGLLNKAGVTSAGGQTYNISGSDDWNAGAYQAYYIQDLDNNGITVSNIITPTITSATYDSDSGVFVVTGTNLFKKYGADNDIDVSKFTVTGEGGNYAISNAISDVEITSATEFTFTVTGTDKTQVDAKLDLFGTQSSGGTTYNLAAAEDWLTAADPAANIADVVGNGITVSVNPKITSATYNSATGVIVVTGTNIQANGGGADIDASKFTVTGEGVQDYTLTDTPDVERSGSTQFTLTLSVTDWNAIAQIFNKNGTASTSGTNYNIAAADDWCTNVTSGNTADLTGNGITANNVAVPTITSATYNVSTGVLTVTGSRLVKKSGALNDIDISKFTVTGEGGDTYNIANTADVEITSGTQFTVTLDAADKNAVNMILNKNGASSTSATTYNLAAAEDWAVGADAAVNVADANGNGITVSNVAVPVITSASYHWSNGVLTATGTGFTKKAGAANDIDASKFTFRGEGGAVYPLIGSADVEITSGTEFTITLDATDKAAVNLLLNKPGTQSNDNTVYNLAAAEDWAVGADAAVNVVDATTSITAGNFNNPPTGGNDVVNISEDSPHTFIASEFTYNDTDSDPFAGIRIETIETAGELKYNGADVISGLDCPDVTKLIFTSAINENASPYAAFTFKVKDDRGGYSIATYTMTINVLPVNDAPVLSNIETTSVDFQEGGSAVNVSSSIAINDFDNINIESAVVAIVGNYKSSEDVLSFSTPAGISGTLSVESGTVNFSGSSSIANYQSALASVAYSNTSANPDTSDRTISFTVNDGELSSNTVSRIITINSVNNPPVIESISNQTTLEDSSLTINLSATDAENNQITFSAISDKNEILLSISDSLLTISSNLNWNGEAVITVIVSDGRASDSTSFNLIVTPVNDAPVINPVADVKINEGETKEIIIEGSDVENDSLAYSALSLDKDIAVSMTGNKLTIIPAKDWVGYALIIVAVNDGKIGTSIRIMVEVLQINDAPVLSNIESEPFEYLIKG